MSRAGPEIGLSSCGGAVLHRRSRLSIVSVTASYLRRPIRPGLLIKVQLPMAVRAQHDRFRYLCFNRGEAQDVDLRADAKHLAGLIKMMEVKACRVALTTPRTPSLRLHVAQPINAPCTPCRLILRAASKAPIFLRIPAVCRHTWLAPLTRPPKCRRGELRLVRLSTIRTYPRHSRHSRFHRHAGLPLSIRTVVCQLTGPTPPTHLPKVSRCESGFVRFATPRTLPRDRLWILSHILASPVLRKARI